MRKHSSGYSVTPSLANSSAAGSVIPGQPGACSSDGGWVGSDGLWTARDQEVDILFFFFLFLSVSVGSSLEAFISSAGF
ncbi:hypothetical protein BDW71DRAFT_193270 [Aspergillus fruticulosus]